MRARSDSGSEAWHAGKPARERARLEQLFLEQLPFVERVVSFIGRRNGMPAQEAEDFASWVKLKLIEGDYAVFRKYRGESQLHTFLTVVVQNLFLDYRTHLWGKFRPSMAAKRMGPLAAQLERLLYRDGCEPESAIEILAARDPNASRESLREIAARLPQRVRRVVVGEEALECIGVGAEAERRIEEEERDAALERTSGVLSEALRTINSEDFLILKMHYQDGFTIAQIASALRLEQRPLYRRRERCLRELRSALERRGLTWDRVREALGSPAIEFPRSRPPVPSGRTDRAPRLNSHIRSGLS